MNHNMVSLFSQKNSRLLSIVLTITILMSLFSNMNNPSYEHNQSTKDSLIPAKWQDWSSSRSAYGIHADPVEKVIVLLAQTSDVEPEDSHTLDYFEDLLFGNEIGSMAHYFAENSRGQTTVEGEVVGWLQLSKRLVDYDEDFWTGVEEYGVGDGVEEALALADNSVDYSLYDQDNDGFIDNLLVVFVGPNDASNGDADNDGKKEDGNAIWPIQWSLQTSFSTNDGVSASNFFVCTEGCAAGIFSHEFGHNLGLPDLYDTDYSSNGVGIWSVMGFGVNKESASHFDAWSKYKLGWIEPTVIPPDTMQMELTLQPVETTGTIVKVPISSTEYWLIEYRSNTAGYYDGSLPDSGVLIWHIDESVPGLNNNDEDHPAVKLIQADGNDDLGNGYNYGDPGDYFLTNSVFNNRSNPGAFTWSGNDLGLSVHIANINENTDTATLAFSRGAAWFHSIDWELYDSNEDGFRNKIGFSYDIDSVESNLDVRVELELYFAATHTYVKSFNRTYTVSGDSHDDFEFGIGYFDEPNRGIYETKVLLWVGVDLVDVYTPAYPTWLEYPEPSNSYDERFETIYFEFMDNDGDGENETVRGYYQITSADPNSPTVQVELICFNQNDPHIKARVIQENMSTNNFSGSHGMISIGVIEIDLSSYDIKPGIIDIWATLSVESDAGFGLEEIFAWPGSEFWWNKLYFETDEIWLRDDDFDGFDDSLWLNLNFDHTWRTNEIIELEWRLWDQTTLGTSPVMLSQKTHLLFVGPRTHDWSGGRDPIFQSFTGSSGTSSPTEVALELVMRYPDGSVESVWYPRDRSDSYYLSPVDHDRDGTIDFYYVFPWDPFENTDTDGDGIGDNSDAFPEDASEWQDRDADGVGDNADAFPDDPYDWVDSDGDGFGDNMDAFPFEAEEWFDSDGDGVGDNSDMCPNTDETVRVDISGCRLIYDVSFTGSNLITNLLLVVICGLPILILMIIVVIKVRRRPFTSVPTWLRRRPLTPVPTWNNPSLSTGHIHAEKTPYSTQLESQQPQIPHPNLDGQFQDGNEWLEFPSQSGIWYYRDSNTQLWIKR